MVTFRDFVNNCAKFNDVPYSFGKDMQIINLLTIRLGFKNLGATGSIVTLVGDVDNVKYEILIGENKSNANGLFQCKMISKVENNTVSNKPAKDSVIVKVRQWVTRRDDNPVPMRTMTGEIVRETAKAVHVKLQGFLQPSKQCLHCGRKLTHPVSLLYGIGPKCGEHYHINPLSSEEELQARYEDMKRAMESITWEGWLPKSQIEKMECGS